VNFEAYAHTAVNLVNSPLTDVSDMVAMFGPDSWEAQEATERDLHALRRARKRLREVFEHGSAGRDLEAVAALNAILETHPVQPRISGHEAAVWHMHVTSRGQSMSTEYLV